MSTSSHSVNTRSRGVITFLLGALYCTSWWLGINLLSWSFSPCFCVQLGKYPCHNVHGEIFCDGNLRSTNLSMARASPSFPKKDTIIVPTSSI